MITNKNDPNCQLLFTSKNAHLMTVRNVKIRKHNNNTKSHFFEFSYKFNSNGVKPVYDRGYRDNLHRFECHTV